MRGRQGLSLPEAILSFFIVTLILILILNLFPTALGSVRAAGQRMQAESLADSLIARYRECPFEQLALGPPLVLPDQPGRGTVFHPTVEFGIVKDELALPELVRSIRVTVRWEGHQITREVVRTRVLR